MVRRDDVETGGNPHGRGPTGDESPVYRTASDESGLEAGDEARFIGRSQVAWRIHRRAGVRIVAHHRMCTAGVAPNRATIGGRP